MNNRQRMRESNRKARQIMLKDGYDEIWFKPHTRRHDLTYTQKGNYRALDLWNLFDGACFDKDGILTFFQVKTNSWAKMEPILQFIKGKSGFQILIINVTLNNNKWQVITREVKP